MAEQQETLDTTAADRAVAFINRLTHTKGRWSRQPFNLRPWQEHGIIRPLFGALQPDGLRQYRTAFIFLPRKNGKTEVAAAIALYCLLSESEAGGEIYCAAVDREQASLVFRVAAGMVKNNPHLSRLTRIVDSQRSITFQRTGSVFRAIPADAPHAHGYNASCVIADELHAWRGRDLWDVLTTSQGSRSQPLTIAITTAGSDRLSLCYQLYDYASKVRDGIVADNSFLPILYEAPREADWRDEAVWRAANPALGDFRNIDEMQRVFREAQTIGPRETCFRQLYLNQWVDSAERWISSDVWNACDGEVDAEALAGAECTAGLDLAYRDDFAALVLCFGPDVDQCFSLLPFFWIPEEGKRDRRLAPLRGWIEAGQVAITPGNTTDFGEIRRVLNDLGTRYHIRELAIDPWNGRQLASELVEDGFEVVEFAQTMRMLNEPTKALESLVMGRRIRHGGHPVLTWMASNVAIERDASGNYRPSKKKSTEKIDGIVAAIMALSRAMGSQPGPSYYEDHALEVG